jgi:malate/lactate dehydrogenase
VLCKLGGKGLEGVMEVHLNDTERAGLNHSTKAVQELVEALQKLEF